MALEGPLCYAAISRFVNPEIGLAAFGGVVLPITYVIEAPILSLLAASTALSKDLVSYTVLRKFAFYLAAFFTVLHLAVALTPLYDWLVDNLIGAPGNVKEAARMGLILSSPTTSMVALRRFNQGILIRFGQQKVVGMGTLIRLVVLLTGLTIGYLSEMSSGVIVGALSVTTALSLEALFTLVMARPLVKGPLSQSDSSEILTLQGVLTFYVPLAMTVVLYLAAIPAYSAAICRMPLVVPSLATWAVVGSLSFLVRSPGLAIIEVTIAHAADLQQRAAIRKFSWQLALLCSAALLVIGGIPLFSELYFQRLSGLDADLITLARITAILLIAVPALSTVQCFYEGLLIHKRRTREITISVVIHLVVAAAVLAVGIGKGTIAGVYVTAVAVFLGYLIQTVWLAKQARDL